MGEGEAHSVRGKGLYIELLMVFWVWLGREIFGDGPFMCLPPRIVLRMSAYENRPFL